MEGKGFRDEFQKFDAKGIAIIGMSADPPAKQRKFAEKHEFQYPLLCDESHVTLAAYGAWGLKKFMGRELEGIHRISYLIDENGVIEKVFPKVKTKTHPTDVLEGLD